MIWTRRGFVLAAGVAAIFSVGPSGVAEEAPLMQRLIERCASDERSLRRFYSEPLSQFRLERLRGFAASWAKRLQRVNHDELDQDGRVDFSLLLAHIRHRLNELNLQSKRNAETRGLLPFVPQVLRLEAARRNLETVNPRAAAEKLGAIAKALAASRRRVEAGRKKGATGDALKTTPVIAFRASKALDRLRRVLKGWFAYRNGFEPEFGWWVRKPYEALDRAMASYAAYLRERVAGAKKGGPAPLIGDPIGREALEAALLHEHVAYSPGQLLAIAEREFAWCEKEGRKAAKELGLEGGWKAAVEHVKGLHVAPGKQDDLVAAQAREAIRFLKDRDLVTIPPLAEETWRLEMLSERRQKTLPFAVYNDQHMMVAYATEGMGHESKLMSMRGNNEHFTRIVTPHELIPGHHLQLFQAARHRAYRSLFRTAFLVEGWALHWEMLLWDLGWHRNAADRVGMLFWRMHRCARIIVTLKFHLGAMSPKEMVDFLANRVGLERDGATGEVRRYIAGAYGPLYQCAYMLGGLQLRALHHELVGNGTMSNREFHDAVLVQNSIPIELIRKALTGEKIEKGAAPRWRFYGDVKGVEVAACPR